MSFVPVFPGSPDEHHHGTTAPHPSPPPPLSPLAPPAPSGLPAQGSPSIMSSPSLVVAAEASQHTIPPDFVHLTTYAVDLWEREAQLDRPEDVALVSRIIREGLERERQGPELRKSTSAESTRSMGICQLPSLVSAESIRKWDSLAAEANKFNSDGDSEDEELDPRSSTSASSWLPQMGNKHSKISFMSVHSLGANVRGGLEVLERGFGVESLSEQTDRQSLTDSSLLMKWVASEAAGAPDMADGKAFAQHLAALSKTAKRPNVAAVRLLVQVFGLDAQFQIPAAFFQGFVIEIATIIKQISSVNIPKLVLITACAAIFALSGTYMDLATDFFLTAEYYMAGHMADFAVTLGIVVVPLILQASLSLLTGRKWWEILGAAFGLKPLFETMRLLLGLKLKRGNMSPLLAVIVCRSIEVFVEALPQVIVQVVIMSSTPHWTFLQVLAICTSVLMTAFIVTLSDHDLASSKATKSKYPELYGWYGKDILQRAATFCACFLRTMCYMLARILTLFVVVSSSGAWTLVGILSVEFCFFCLMLGLLGNFRMSGHGQGGIFASCLAVLCKFMNMQFVDTVCMRIPFMLGGIATTSCETYALISNFAFCVVAHQTASDNVHPWLSLSFIVGWLCAFTGVFYATSALIISMSEPGAGRRLWLQQQTIQMYIRDVLWDSEVPTSYGPSLDDHRAFLLAQFIPHYWCKDDVRDWIATNWTQWCEHPPTWFVDKWISHIPTNLLPEGYAASLPVAVIVPH